jgi:hypothetical protein
MTAVDGSTLLAAGYSRALWIPRPEPHWVRPDGHSAVSQAEALREVAEMLGEEDDV